MAIVWVRTGNGRMRDLMGGMGESGGWVGSLETRDKLGAPAKVALVGAENNRIKEERVWNKTKRWGTDLH